MRINHNLAALNTHRQLTGNTAGANKSLEKLSSGFRINRAADDAAGLAISEKMRGQIRGLDQASRNAQDAISLIQTAEGAMSTTHNILQRMRELAVQASNDTSTDSDRAQLQKEITQLKGEIDRISTTTEFNTKKLLNGSLSAVKSSQGTAANSDVIDALDTAATASTATGGLQVALSDITTGQAGKGYTHTAGAALNERTIIQTGVNDSFDITINGVAYTDVTIGASNAQGYTRSEFVEALNAAVKTKVGTEWDNEFNQAYFSLSSDNHLVANTVATGIGGTTTKIEVQIDEPTAGTDVTALAAMGYEKKAINITGSKDLTASNLAAGAGGANSIDVVIGTGATAKTINLETYGITATATHTMAQYKDALQKGLDTVIGVGAITVGDDGNGHLTFQNNVSAETFSIANNGASTIATTLGIVGSASQVAQAGNTTRLGQETIHGNLGGTVISKDANDQFNISVNGEAAQTLTLTAKRYATRQDLVNEVNNQINANSNLVGKVSASLDGDKVVFTSNSTGSSSDVTVTGPTATAQSALASLGYAGSAGNITGTKNIADGLDLSTAANAKMEVKLGNRTVTIDLNNQDIIKNTATTTTESSRDAIVKALQAEFDKAFGVGALTVNTNTTATNAMLTVTNNTRGSYFSISDVGVTATGATFLFGSNKIASVAADGTNVKTAGKDAVVNDINNNTLLTGLADSDGNSVGLTAGNVINIVGSQNGKGFNTSVAVKADSTVADVLNALRSLKEFAGATVSLDTTTGKINIKGADGADKDISNLSFSAQKSATDTSMVTDFNRVFGSFAVTQQAQNASSDKSLTMQIGANQGQVLQVDINDVGINSLRLNFVDVSTAKGAQDAVSVVNNALETVSTERAKLGALQNRLEHTISNLGTSSENLTASESRIRDVDMAKEMMEFTKNNILSQAAQAMLAQANQQPQGVLQLLR